MRIRNARELAAVVRDHRRERAWTQSDLAERIGASRDWVINLEKGKTTVELGLVLQALKALELSLDLSPAPPPSTDLNLSEILDPSAPADD